MKKQFAILGASAMLMLGLVGCTTAQEDAQNNLNTSIINAVNSSATITAITDIKLDDFDFLASNINQTENISYVDINGIGEISNNDKKAYVNVQYKVDSSTFSDVDEDDSVEVLNKLTEIVQTSEISNIDCVYVTDINEMNNAMSNLFECSNASYNYDSSLTYSVKNLKFNTEDNCFTFEAYSNVKYSKTTTEYIRRYIKSGKSGSWKIIRTTETDYKESYETQQVVVKATPEEIEQMKQDSSIALDKFIEVVNNKEKDSYFVKTIDVQSEKNFEDASEFSM